MNWWSEAEAQALRAKSPLSMGQTLWQRLKAAGVDPDLSFTPAYDLARLYSLAADLVKAVDSLLAEADGDTAAIRRHGLLLYRWVAEAEAWVRGSFDGFNGLVDALEFEPEALAIRDEVEPTVSDLPPEEEPKRGGRYRDWHLLYERLDLKLASTGMAESTHRGLARSLARVYEQALLTMRLISALEKEPNPRFRSVARALLDLNTTWHFDLGPFHLGQGRLRPKGLSATGLTTWLFLAFSGSSGPMADDRH